MQETETTTLSAPTPRAGLSRFYTDLIGRRVFTFLLALHGVGAFALITFGVLLRKFSIARSVVRPLVAREISRAGVKLLPMDELGGFVREHRIKMAILTVPGNVAQEVANALVEAGILAILNFAPIILQVPDKVVVNNVDLAIELENLSYFIQ